MHWISTQRSSSNLKGWNLLTFLGSFARLRFFEMLQKRRKEKDSKPNIYLLSTVSLQPKRFIWFPWFLFVGFPGFTLAYYSITPSSNQVLWDSLRNCAWNIITFLLVIYTDLYNVHLSSILSVSIMF